MLKPTPGAKPLAPAPPDSPHGPLAPRLRRDGLRLDLVVPPKIDWTRLSPRAHHRSGEQRTGVPAGQGGFHRVSAGRGVRAVRSGRRSRAMGSSGRGAAPQSAAWPRRPRRTSDRGYPSRRYGRRLRIELIMAQLPQILVMHDASDGSQVGSCSGEPPHGNQYLSWVRTLTTTAWARAALDDHHGGGPGPTRYQMCGIRVHRTGLPIAPYTTSVDANGWAQADVPQRGPIHSGHDNR